MTTKHTAGPWVWVEGTDAISRRWNNFDWPVANVGNHRLGWHEDKNCESREAGANARLIAAAPDLLELVKTANHGTKGAHTAMWQTAARAAIAKATGATA